MGGLLEDFSNAFLRGKSAQPFNGDISKWDVSRGKNFMSMFVNQYEFNSNLSMWNVGKSTYLAAMFSACQTFNSDLSKWQVDRVTDFFGMFSINNGSGDFNSDLSKWNVHSGTSFAKMFKNQMQFNQNYTDFDEESNPFRYTGCEMSEVPTDMNACQS